MKGLPHPKELSTTSTDCNILGLSDGKGYTILLFRTPRH
jgi:hypothetical protein